MQIKNEDEILSFLKKCGTRKIRLKYKCGDKNIWTEGHFCKNGKGKNVLLISSIDNCVGHIWSGKKSDVPKEIRGVSRKTLVEKLRQHIFLKISCNMYEKTYFEMCNDLKNAGKLDYTFVAEDKRSGCNLIKFLMIGDKAVDHNAHRDAICFGRKNEMYYKTIMKLYEDTFNIDNAEKIWENNESVDVIYC